VTARSTIEVLEDHLARRSQGDIEGDLGRNYLGDVVLLCEHGVLKGQPFTGYYSSFVNCTF
jgi:hypothetical protein